MSSLQVVDLRFEHHPTGLGVSVASPRLSWRYTAGAIPSSWVQTSHTIEIKRASTTDATIFSSESDTPVLVSWPDRPLKSGESASVRVKASGITKGNQALDSDWSEWATVETAILAREDWTAKPIAAPSRMEGKHPDEWGLRPVRFRKTFELRDSPGRSRLYITALGLYEAYLNGVRIGDECLAPGWTAYQARIQYQVFDVESLLRPGEVNVLSVEVAEGWYAGRLLWGEGIPCFYGDRIGVLAQLDIGGTNEKGSFCLNTDETWECCPSPIVGSDIYDGETYDLSLETNDWHTSGVWTKVDALPFPTADLVASSSPPVRVTETIKPIQIFKDPEGTTLIDFGQNLVGKVHIPHLTRPTGHRLRIRHAEVLEHGRLGTRPLRRAKQTDTIIFGPDGELADWSPHFTYHGFRYVEIQGWDADEITPDSLSAHVLHTDMRRTGSFACSNPDLNQLHRNVTWSMRGNFVSIPTDCPQRDERLGWTGDIQAFAPTASYLFDCGGMLSNWMRDVTLEQAAGGGIVPLVVPNAMKHGPWPAVPQAVWDDVIILVPWTLHTWFGDVGVLRDTYPGMKDYLRTLRRGDDGLWAPDLWQLGDWLDPNAPPSEPGLARTDGVLVADAYLVHVTGIMAKIAVALGNTQDATSFAAESERLRGVFQDKYIAKSGLIVSDSQTALALALLYDLHEKPAQKKTAGDRLARLVRYAKFQVSTGFAGTPVILHALTRAGHTQLAYRMLLETSCPSWLYPVKMGATTVWERWDSMLADGTINPGEMTSFNHYALGSVADWVHGTVGGIAPLEAGWRRFSVRPVPGGDVTSAKVEFLSAQGDVQSDWKMEGSEFTLRLTVPPNSTAVVELPDGSAEQVVGSGEHTFECRFDVEAEGQWPPKSLLTQFRDHEGYVAKHE